MLGFVVFGGSKKADDTSNQSGNTSQNEEAPADATIAYTDNGFEPAVTTISAGQTVKFINNSTKQLQVASDEHPAHTDNSELNVGIIAKSDSRTVTLKKAGNWGVHNHLNAADTTSITVQ